jgi:hypothetical protein
MFVNFFLNFLCSMFMSLLSLINNLYFLNLDFFLLLFSQYDGYDSIYDVTFILDGHY